MKESAKNQAKRGTTAEGWREKDYKKMGCIVQKAYLKATYIGSGIVVARPGDLFPVTIEVTEKGKKKKKRKGTVDLIAICPDAVYIDQVTTRIAEWKDILSHVYERQRNLDKAIPKDMPVIARVSYYPSNDRQALRIWQRDADGKWPELLNVSEAIGKKVTNAN